MKIIAGKSEKKEKENPSDFMSHPSTKCLCIIAQVQKYYIHYNQQNCKTSLAKFNFLQLVLSEKGICLC